MILEKDWQNQLSEIEQRFYTERDFHSYNAISPKDIEFLLNLIDELKKVAF